MTVARAVAAIGVVAASATAGAQGPTFSSRVDVVRVDALVTDADGRTIAGLGPDDFEVVDNGVAQHVEHVLAEQLPLNVVFALDLSGSVTHEQAAQLKDASHAVLDSLKRGDQAGLVTFTDAVSVRATLTPDLATIRERLDGQSGGLGDTSLVDATYTSMLLAEGEEARGLVMVFSDGAETGSFLNAASVLQTAQRTDAVVYAASVGKAPPTTFLHDLCNATGGRVLKVESMAKLREAFLAILEEFRHRYLISYTPRGVAKGGWHTLSVRIKNRRASVKARPGYLAGN